jgi:hypothetical protein
MSLSELEQAVLAYYVAGHANELNIAGRWYPYGELVLVIEDKISVNVRKFGSKARGAAKTASKALLDLMIEKGAWATKQNEYGGSMHQFQPDAYKVALRELQASDPLIVAAKEQGPEFWADKFAALTGA